MTQVGIALMASWCLVDPAAGRARDAAGHCVRCRRSSAGSLPLAAAGRGLSAGGHPALADGPAGPARGRSARFRVPVGLRGDPVPPGQPTSRRGCSTVAALAAAGLGPVPHLARGATWSTWGWSRSSWRSWRSGASSAAIRSSRLLVVLVGGLALPEPGSVRARVPPADPLARLLVLPGPGAVEPGDLAGPGDPGGQGAGSLPRTAGRRADR